MIVVIVVVGGGGVWCVVMTLTVAAQYTPNASDNLKLSRELQLNLICQSVMIILAQYTATTNAL